jgi:hypothetical protein
MYHLDTYYPTIVYDNYLIDPSIMNHLLQGDQDQDTNKKRKKVEYDYTDGHNPYLSFICDISSGFLKMNQFSHQRERWYMHCENDVAYSRDVVTVLMYLHIDEEVKDGNLRYKDKKNNKLTLEIKSGTTVIMDGNVPHKPQDPYGSGRRDLIIISFDKSP